MFDSVEEPVQFRSPATTIGVIEHTLEVGQSLLVCFLHCQSFPEVAHVIDALQLRDSYNSTINIKMLVIKTPANL